MFRGENYIRTLCQVGKYPCKMECKEDFQRQWCLDRAWRKVSLEKEEESKELSGMSGSYERAAWLPEGGLCWAAVDARAEPLHQRASGAFSRTRSPLASSFYSSTEWLSGFFLVPSNKYVPKIQWIKSVTNFSQMLQCFSRSWFPVSLAASQNQSAGSQSHQHKSRQHSLVKASWNPNNYP